MRLKLLKKVSVGTLPPPDGGPPPLSGEAMVTNLSPLKGEMSAIADRGVLS